MMPIGQFNHAHHCSYRFKPDEQTPRPRQSRHTCYDSAKSHGAPYLDANPSEVTLRERPYTKHEHSRTSLGPPYEVASQSDRRSKNS